MQVALNNLDVSSEYILRLKNEIESSTMSGGGAGGGSRAMFTKQEDQEKVKTALADLLDISKRFKQVLEVCFPLCCEVMLN